MNQNTVAAGEAEFDPARERTTLVNALAEAARAALEFDPLAAAVLGAIPATEPQQYVIAGTPAGISKMREYLDRTADASAQTGVLTKEAFEEIAESWDGCVFDGIEIGDALRRDFARLASPSPVSEAQAERVPGGTAEQQARYAIDGAIQYGRENRNPPPSAEHWLYEYWNIGQQLRELGKTGWDNITPLVAPTAKEAEQASAQAAAAEVRDAALEEAATICDNNICQTCWNAENCAEDIRALRSAVGTGEQA